MLPLLLTLLIALYLIDVLASTLNLRTLSATAPKGFEDVYDADNYARMQDYTRRTSRLGLIESAFSLAILIAFWLGGGFEILDQWVRGFSFGPILTGLVFVGILVVAKTLLTLPFDLYDTFVLEERFGFNKTTPVTFVADLAKSLVMTAILGGLLGAIVLALFLYGGTLAWLYGWLATSAIMLLIVFIGPAYIMPLFNKFTPLEDGPLRSAIIAYAEQNDFPLQDISVMDGSRRSTKANAFFTGLGSTKRIVLFDTLIAGHSVDELVAVLAHEIGHFKCRHITKRLATSILTMGALFYLASHAIQSPKLFETFGLSQTSIYAGLVCFSIAIKPINWLVSLVSARTSRRHEYQADHFAATTTGATQPLVTALKRLSGDNLANLAPHRLYVALYHSHPALTDRVAALQKIKV